MAQGALTVLENHAVKYPLLSDTIQTISLQYKEK